MIQLFTSNFKGLDEYFKTNIGFKVGTVYHMYPENGTPDMMQYEFGVETVKKYNSNPEHPITIITYSEHIFNALMVQLASKKISKDNIEINYIEEKKEEYTLRIIKLSDKGFIEGKSPRGFFEANNIAKNKLLKT